MNLSFFQKSSPGKFLITNIMGPNMGLTNLAVPVIRKWYIQTLTTHNCYINTYGLTALDSIGPFEGESLPGGSKTASTLLYMQRKVSGKKDRL